MREEKESLEQFQFGYLLEDKVVIGGVSGAASSVVGGACLIGNSGAGPPHAT